MQHLGICVGCCCELPTQRSAVQIVIAALAKLWYQCKAKRRAAPSLLYLSNICADWRNWRGVTCSPSEMRTRRNLCQQDSI